MTQPGPPRYDRAIFARINRRWVLQRRLSEDEMDPSPEQLGEVAAALVSQDGGRAPLVRVLATPSTYRSVIAQLWSGAITVRSLVPGEPDPEPEELAHLAARVAGWNDGVPPSVRVLSSSTLRRPSPG